ncbi:hypothetical protein D3C72_1903330 [compost metagenome]
MYWRIFAICSRTLSDQSGLSSCSMKMSLIQPADSSGLVERKRNFRHTPFHPGGAACRRRPRSIRNESIPMSEASSTCAHVRLSDLIFLAFRRPRKRTTDLLGNSSLCSVRLRVK